MAQQLGLFDRNASIAGTTPASASPAVARDAAPGAVPRGPSSHSAPLAIRESRRARRLTLRMLPPCTLELVVPSGTRAADVAAFVHEHRLWIERARREIAEHYPDGDSLPQHVELLAVGERYAVRYEHEPAAREICRLAEDGLLVRTRDAGHLAAERLLRDWLIEQARLHLKPWLAREAERMALRPRAVRVRLQRTRWGSCSSSGNINLNAGLMFLEPGLVRYLIVHELSHMFALNHSRRFWRHVERFEPNYRELDRRLGAAWSAIPIWAHERARGAGLDFA